MRTWTENFEWEIDLEELVDAGRLINFLDPEAALRAAGRQALRPA